MSTVRKIAVFDLDGTLINSVGGIAESVNRTRADVGLPSLPLQEIGEYTGDGARVLLRRSFEKDGMPMPEETLLNMMLQHYADAPTYDTTLYPGVLEGLQKLKENGWLLAVFSNKHARIGLPILRHFGIDGLFVEIIGGGSGFPLKPAPDALLYLGEKYHVSRQNIWMVGDNHTDMNCAAAANTRSLFCDYGFGHQKDSPVELRADTFLEGVEKMLAAPQRISVLSYNIDSCYGVDRQLSPQRSLDLIRTAEASLVALQEISIHNPMRGNLDYPALAAKSLSMEGLFGRSLFFNGQNADGGMFGNALLSEFPMEVMETLPLDVPAGGEPRSALIVKILAEKPYYVAVTHLPFQGEYENDDGIRLACLQKLQSRIAEKKYTPIILTGDLNSKPDTAPICFLRKKWTLANDVSDYPPTAFSQKFGWVHIDYIAFYPQNAFKVVDFCRFGERGPSDHYPVLATLEPCF